MRDTFTSRLFSVALVIIAIATIGAVIYASLMGLEVNDYLAGIAGLSVGALLPSPLDARVGNRLGHDPAAPGPMPVEDVGDQP